jgi:cytochrome c553
MKLKFSYGGPMPLSQALKFLVCASVFTSLWACGEPGLTASIKDGEKKSAICGQCHGRNGIAIIPIYPNLAGQKQGYMELQLAAFRSGQRVNAAMSPHAKRLTDQDITDLSAYYANMDASGKNVFTSKVPNAKAETK